MPSVGGNVQSLSSLSKINQCDLSKIGPHRLIGSSTIRRYGLVGGHSFPDACQSGCRPLNSFSSTMSACVPTMTIMDHDL